MYTVLAILHVLIAFVLILVVLIQSGKGADIGAAFGGGAATQAIFGGRGAATFLHKLTAGLAILFMLSSLALAIYGSRPGPSVILEEKPKPAASSGELTEAPAAPTPAAPQQPTPSAPTK